MKTTLTLSVLLLSFAIQQSLAVPIQIQLVKQSAPDQLISPADAPAGGYADHCEIFIDGKNPLQPRTTEGQRFQAEMSVDLAPGKHTLAPGAHEFTIGADNAITTTDPGLSADKTRLKVLMTPLTLETRDAETGARRVAGLLQPVLDANGRIFDRPWHFAPRNPTCIVIYLPAGLTFALYPQSATLELSASAVMIKSDPTNSLKAEGLTITATMTPLRFTLQRNGHQIGRGIYVNLSGNAMHMEHPSVYQWGAPSCNYKWLLPTSVAPIAIQLQHTVHELGRMAPGAPLNPAFTFEDREFPYWSLLVSRLDERNDGTTSLLTGISKLKYRSGETIDVRYTFDQSGVAPALSAARLAALIQPDEFAAHGALPWQTLSVTGEAGKATIKLPDDLPSNRFRIRLAMIEANGDASKSPFFRDFSIGVVNPAQSAIASLFVPARRWNYVAGEEIELQGSLQLKSPANGSLRLRLRGEQIDRLFDAAPAAQLAPGRFAQGWVLGADWTRALKPSTYSLTAVFADASGKSLAESPPQQVTIASTVRRSLFPGVIDCYSYGAGDAFLGGTPQAARRIFGVGADVIRFDSYTSTLPSAPLEPMEGRRSAILPDDPDLPATELLDAPQGTLLAFDEALLYGAAILPSLFPSDGPRIETQLSNLLAEQRRFVRLHAQYYRRSPSYAGISYSHWSGLSSTGNQPGTTNPPPDDAVKATRQAIWENFCKRYGFSGDVPTTWHQYGAIVGGGATPANPDLWEKWIRYTNELIPSVHRDWASAARDICPQLIGTDSRCAPGFWNGPREAYDSTNFGNHYQNSAGLNLIEGVTNDDWGIEPYSLELMSDLFSFGWRSGRPVWVGGWAQNGIVQSEYQREAIQTLARGAIPALYGASLAPVFSSRNNDDWMHQDWGRRQATQRVFQTTAAYGEWSWRFATDKPLAILVSFSQAARVEGRAGYAQLSPHGAALYEAYVAALLAGYSPTFIYEEEIAADPKVLHPFKAIFLVNITQALPEPITRALQSFAAGGGAVLADAASAADLPATARVPLTFDAYLKWGISDFGKENNSSEYTSGYWRALRQVALDKRAAMQAALDKIVKPAAQTEAPGALLTSARAGDAILVYATNDTPLAYKYSTDMARPYIYLHQCWRSPDATARITLHANDGVLYDALRVREVPVEKTPDGLRFTAAFEDMSGTVYALLPRRIAGVQVEGAARAGSITLRARANADDGKAIAAPIPLEIVVTDSASSERYRLYRVAESDGWSEELPVGLNDQPGAWTITVRELLSGKSIAAKLDVQPAAAPGASIARAPIVVTDRAAIVALLKSNRPLTIALDRRQAALQPIAKTLNGILAAAGHQTQTRWLDELPRGPLYTKVLWSGSPLPPADPVQGAVILLGTSRDNALLAKLCEANVMLREGSENYPGGDGAVITHVWSAFSGDDPALAVMSTSDAGLRAAVAHLAALVGSQPSASYDPAPALESARAYAMPEMFRDTWAKHPLTPPAVAAEKLQALKPLAGTPGQSSDWAINPAGDAIRAIAVSADASVRAIGSDSFTHAVVRLEKGATKPDANAPRQNRQFVQNLAITPDGKYIVAATSQPPAVFVQDATGKEIWSKTDIPFNWSTDPRWMRDEPDYFAMSPTGDRVVIREKDQRLVCYETTTGKQAWERSYASADARVWRDAQRIRFSGDGSKLIVSVISYLIDPTAATKLGNTATEALPPDLKALDAEVRHPLLSLNPATGDILWTRTERTIPVAASTPRGHPFFPLFTPRPDLDGRGLYFQQRVLGVYLTVSRDGNRIIAGDDQGYQNVYAADGKPIASYAVPGRPEISPDGSTLAVYRDAVVLVDLASGNSRTLALPGEEEFSDIAWSLDSRKIAATRWNGDIQIVEATGTPVGTVPGPHGVGAVLMTLPTGDGWLAGTSDGRLIHIDPGGRVR